MALIDHFAPNAGTEDGGNGYERFAGGEFADWLQLLAVGDVTKSELIAEFGLTEEPTPDADETQLNQIITHFQGLAGLAEKASYLLSVQAALRQRKTGRRTEAQSKSIMQIT